MKKSLNVIENQKCYICGKKYADKDVWFPAYDEFDQEREETHLFAHTECLSTQHGTNGIFVAQMD